MTSPPHPITNGDTADDLFARFGTLGVGGVNHSYTPHPSSVPSPKSGHTHFHMHSPAQQTTPYTPYADDELSYWTSGDQPNLGTPCTPSSSGNDGSHYPHGGPPPDLTPPSVLPDGDFPSLGEAYGTQQQHSATANNQAQQHRQGGRNRFDEYPAERSHASNNMVYSPPQQQQRPHHQQPHSYQNMNPGAGFDHYYAPHGGRQGYWMSPPHGMYMAGETNNDLQVSPSQTRYHCMMRIRRSSPFSLLPFTAPWIGFLIRRRS